MSINIILAVGRNGEVGASHTSNGLPWHNPEDMAFFRRKTEGNVVVMGRKTFDALPFKNGLPNRKNIVVTSKGRNYLGLNKKIVNYVSDSEWLVSEGFSYLESFASKGVYILGGVSIYNQLNKYADTAYITRIDREYPKADAHIDLSWLDEFELVDTETLNDYSYVETWKRKK